MKGRPLLSASLGVLVAAHLCSPSLATAQIGALQPKGEPAWTITDIHLFSCPTGTRNSGFEEFFARAQAILPEPEHVPYGQGVGPGQPHPPPYDHEIADGLAALGLVDAFEYEEDDFRSGRGVCCAFMAIPSVGAEIGVSADSPSGPIIPSTRLPMQLSFETRKNGASLDTLKGAFPDAATIQSLEGGGYSHIPFFNGDSAMFYGDMDPVGTYQFVLTLTDASDDGWTFAADFTVGSPPDPVVGEDVSGGGEDVTSGDAGVTSGEPDTTSGPDVSGAAPDAITAAEDTTGGGTAADIATSSPAAADGGGTDSDVLPASPAPTPADEPGTDGCAAAPGGSAAPTVFGLLLLAALGWARRAPRRG